MMIQLSKEWVFEPKQVYKGSVRLKSKHDNDAHFKCEGFAYTVYGYISGDTLPGFGTITSVEFIDLLEVTEEKAREILQTNACTPEQEEKCLSTLCREKCCGIDEWANYEGVDFEACEDIHESIKTLITAAGSQYGFLYKIQTV